MQPEIIPIADNADKLFCIELRKMSKGVENDSSVFGVFWHYVASNRVFWGYLIIDPIFGTQKVEFL